MLRKFESWRKERGGRLRGLVILIAGLITLIFGYGAWRNPHLDWEGFTQTFLQLWQSSVNEVIRMLGDPFSFIGLIVMIVGVVVAINGVSKLISG